VVQERLVRGTRARNGASPMTEKCSATHRRSFNNGGAVGEGRADFSEGHPPTRQYGRG